MPPSKTAFTIFVEEHLRLLWEADQQWANEKDQRGVTKSLVLDLHQMIVGDVLKFMENKETECTKDIIKNPRNYNERHSCKLYRTIEKLLHRSKWAQHGETVTDELKEADACDRTSRSKNEELHQKFQKKWDEMKELFQHPQIYLFEKEIMEELERTHNQFLNLLEGNAENGETNVPGGMDVSEMSVHSEEIGEMNEHSSPSSPIVSAINSPSSASEDFVVGSPVDARSLTNEDSTVALPGTSSRQRRQKSGGYSLDLSPMKSARTRGQALLVKKILPENAGKLFSLLA